MNRLAPDGSEIIRQNSRQRNDRELQEGIRHPLRTPRGIQQPASDQPDRCADHHAEAELLADESGEARLAGAAAPCAMKNSRNGTDRPSFRPASTLSAWRIRIGTVGC